MHQLDEDDEDYDDELSNLNASWNLPRCPTCRDADGTENGGSNPGGGTTSARLGGGERITTRRIFIPINDQFGMSRASFVRPGGGNHWTILLWEIDATYYEIDGEFHVPSVGARFYHFDSSRGVNESAAEAVAKKLQKVCLVRYDAIPYV